MERSPRAATIAEISGPLAPLCGIVIIGTIVLAGCHASTSPSRQSVFQSGACYPAGQPVCSTVARPQAPLEYAAAKPVASEEDDRAMESDYRAVIAAWRQLEAGNAAAVADYRKSLAWLLARANRAGRLDPRGRLTLATAQGAQIVPISYFGFAWKPADFSSVRLAYGYRDGDMEHHYYTAGLGVSLVGIRESSGEETFFRQRQSFPISAVLRMTDNGAALEFYNPLVFGAIPLGGAGMFLDRDLTAPLIYLKEESPKRYVEGFFDPGGLDDKPKLIMMEPYQSGKIPVVFVHGLGSDPLTWADAVNRLRADRDIYARFQFWYFRYPTGGDLLQSAAVLREQLIAAREACDPQHGDPALEQMVLVGHSLGGLVAQLQVSYSYDLLWQKIARQPIEAVLATPSQREQLRAMCYFDPSPLVKRVVFMATPHHGSGMARRVVGRAASRLVHYSPEEEAEYHQLVDANRDVFREFLWEKKPTAIDLLEPDNPFLDAMARMPIGRCVRWHSIIGDSVITLQGASDGVVPVSSAKLPGATSERLVSARHTRVNKVDDAVDELARILREHAAASKIP